MPDGKKIVETLKLYFNNVVKSLNLQCDPEHVNDVSDANDAIEIAIKKVLKSSYHCEYKWEYPKDYNFSFDEIGTYSIKKIIDNLDSRKVEYLEEFQAITYRAFQISLLSFYILFGMMKYLRI